MGFRNRTMIFKNFTAVFAVNILCNEYILISVMWNWMCLDTRTAALGSGGWRSLFKYLYREEDKARNCYENSSLHVSKDRLTVQGFTRTTPWRYLNNRLTLWGAVRGVCISKPKEKISFSSNLLEGIFRTLPVNDSSPSVSPLEIVFCSSHRENWGFSGPDDEVCLSWQTLYKSDMTLGMPLGIYFPRA